MEVGKIRFFIIATMINYQLVDVTRKSWLPTRPEVSNEDHPSPHITRPIYLLIEAGGISSHHISYESSWPYALLIVGP